MNLLALFVGTDCSFSEAFLEWLIIGTGFFLFGWLLKSIFSGNSYKRQYRALLEKEGKWKADLKRMKDKESILESQLSKLSHEKALGSAATASVAAVGTASIATAAMDKKPLDKTVDKAVVPLREHHDLKDENLQLQRQLEKKEAAIEDLRPKDKGLQQIEGIGPKLEEVLIQAGVNSIADLANQDRDDLQNILDAAGDRFRIHDPRSWPHQADLIKRGEHKKLKAYQDFLKGGRE